jgi:hypothetical protein
VRPPAADAFAARARGLCLRCHEWRLSTPELHDEARLVRLEEGAALAPEDAEVRQALAVISARTGRGVRQGSSTSSSQ